METFPGKFLYHLPLFPIFRKFWLNGKRPERALFIQPKIPEISVRNQMERFRFGPTGIFGTTFAPLQVVHFDRSAHFGRSDRNVPFHLTTLLSPVPLFFIPLTRPRASKNNNQMRGGLGWVRATGMYRSIGHVSWVTCAKLAVFLCIFSRNKLACSKRSDGGERCEVKKAMKSRGGLAFIFSRSFLLRTAPHYLNAWNRLRTNTQAFGNVEFPNFPTEISR